MAKTLKPYIYIDIKASLDVTTQGTWHTERE